MIFGNMTETMSGVGFEKVLVLYSQNKLRGTSGAYPPLDYFIPAGS
jgi:hypothetical protein